MFFFLSPSFAHQMAVSFCIDIGAKMAPPTMLIGVGAGGGGAAVGDASESGNAVMAVPFLLVVESLLEPPEKTNIRMKMTTGMHRNRDTNTHLNAKCHGRPRLFWCSFLNSENDVDVDEDDSELQKGESDQNVVFKNSKYTSRQHSLIKRGYV